MISVIVPVYNVEPYLGKCLDSILAQTYSDMEVLIVDDGSTDHCGEICDRYATQDHRIQVFHTVNHGLSAARNVGLDHTHGEYIVFVDSDDWIEPNMYEKLLNIAKQTDADIVTCRFYQEYKDKTEESSGPLSMFTIEGNDILRTYLLQHNICQDSWNNLFKADLFQAVRYPEGRSFEDYFIKVLPLTNFMVRPVEMIVSDQESEMTADFVTRASSFRKTLISTDFNSAQRFKGMLNKTTIALAYYGGDSDLEILKVFLGEMEWPVKTGVKAQGIYLHEGRLVFVCGDTAVDKTGTPVENILQLDGWKEIDSGILCTDPLTKEKLLALGKWLMRYNEPAKTVPILAWAAGCFVKEHLRMKGVKYPMKECARQLELSAKEYIPDIICCYRGRFYGFEVKTDTGKPTGLQEATIRKINRQAAPPPSYGLWMTSGASWKTPDQPL